MVVEKIEYTVQEGDTLAGIALTYYQEKSYYKNLARFNGIADPDKLEVGQVLQIPMMYYEYEKSLVEDDTPTVVFIPRVYAQGTPIPKDALLAYLPGVNEYVVIPDEKIEAFLEEIETLGNFAIEISDTRSAIENASSRDESLKKAREMQVKAKKLFEGLDTNPEDAIQEIVVLQKSPKCKKVRGFEYIRKKKLDSGEITAEFRKIGDENVKKRIQELSEESDGDNKRAISAELKANLWKSEEFEKHWPEVWRFQGDNKAAKSFGDDNKYVSATVGAQWLRYTHAATLDSSFNLKEAKLALKLQGSVEYALAEGKIQAGLAIPDKDGGDLFGLFRLDDEAKDALIRTGRECRFRLYFNVKGFVLAGASLSGSLALPNIDLKEPEPDAEVGANVSGFLGGGAGGSVTPSFQWAPDKTDFGALLEGQLGGELNAGIGIELAASAGLTDGEFRIRLSAQLVGGLGGKGSISVAVGIDEGFELIAHLLYSVNYHRLDEIKGNAFTRFAAISFATFLGPIGTGVSAIAAITNAVIDFSGWLTNRRRAEDLDTVKDTIRQNLKDTEKLKKAPPETLARLLLTIMETPEEKDFEDIITVLQAVDSEHEMAWVLRRITDLPTETDDQKGVALKAGVRKLQEHGSELRGFSGYYSNLTVVLVQKGIIL